MAARKRLVRPSGPSVLRLLKKGLTYQEPIRSVYKQGRVHASSLGYMCPRAEVIIAKLLDAGEVQLVDESTLERSATFAMGTGMHWIFQNEVADVLRPYFVGQWECRVCKKVHGTPEEMIPKPTECSCGAPQVSASGRPINGFEYQEIRVENTDYRISGYMDGILRLPGADGDGVFELKSIGRKFEDVTLVPTVEHAIQLQSYLWMKNLKWGIILYWGKGQYRDPYIEHYLERDDDTIAAIQETLMSVWNGIETGVLPTRICRSSECRRAENCQVAKWCFEGQDGVAGVEPWEPES